MVKMQPSKKKEKKNFIAYIVYICKHTVVSFLKYILPFGHDIFKQLIKQFVIK